MIQSGAAKTVPRNLGPDSFPRWRARSDRAPVASGLPDKQTSSRFRRRLGPLARFALGWRRHLGNDIKNRQIWCGSFRIYTDGLWPSGMAQSPQPYDLAARHLVRAPLDAVCSGAKVRDWATIKRRPVDQSSSRLRSGQGSPLKPKLQPSRQLALSISLAKSTACTPSPSHPGRARPR